MLVWTHLEPWWNKRKMLHSVFWFNVVMAEVSKKGIFLLKELFQGWDGALSGTAGQRKLEGNQKETPLSSFTLSITNCLRDWKQLYSSTWMMHLSSALSETATGLSQGPCVCFSFFISRGGGSGFQYWLHLQHAAICSTCLHQNILMYSVVTAESISLHFRENYQLGYKVKPVPVGSLPLSCSILCSPIHSLCGR